VDAIVDILNNNPDINVNQLIQGKDIPLLFFAIDRLCPEICEVLCKKGAFIGPFSGLNVTPLGYLLSKTNSGYQKLSYIELRIVLLLLRYGANPDYAESGMLSSREMLDIIGYNINNAHLVTKSSLLDMDLHENEGSMIIEDNVYGVIDDSIIDNSIIDDTIIEFKDEVDSKIMID
jgi:hypothetical protein